MIYYKNQVLVVSNTQDHRGKYVHIYSRVNGAFTEPNRRAKSAKFTTIYKARTHTHDINVCVCMYAPGVQQCRSTCQK